MAVPDAGVSVCSLNRRSLSASVKTLTWKLAQQAAVGWAWRPGFLKGRKQRGKQVSGEQIVGDF